MEPIIVIAPCAGFCNRIRAICFAIKYAKLVNMDIYHIWNGKSNYQKFEHEMNIQNCGFEHFFNGPLKKYTDILGKVNICYTYWKPGHFWWDSHSYGQKILESNIIKSINELPLEKSNESILIQSQPDIELSKEERHLIYNEYFIPNDAFVKQLSIFEEKPIGIHIRKINFYCYFPESEVKDDLIYEWVKKFNEYVIIFSDDKEFEKKARTFLKNPVICEFEKLEQKQEDRAFLEFLTLSKCKKIYGTKLSSFSEEATVFGNVLYEPITIEKTLE